MASLNKTRSNNVINTAQTLATSNITPPKTFGRTSHNYRTANGAPAYSVTNLEELRRSVLSCMLWESTFYENGVTIADRIASLVPLIEPEEVVKVAYEARVVMKLRHVPLLLAIEMLKHETHKIYVRKLIPLIVNRADEMSELLSLFWKDELTALRSTEGKFNSQRAKRKLPMQLIRGIKLAFAKFDDYQLTKYLGNDKPVKMADVIRLVHPDPKEATKNLPNYKHNVDMAAVYKSIVDGSARAPEDTWEVALSAAGKEGKKKVFEDLLDTNRLPAMALLRNLRGMTESQVDLQKISTGLEKMKVERILPYRFITARRYAPSLSAQLEQAMFKCLHGVEKLAGKTVILIDISGSMNSMLSGKSEMRRVDAAAGLAVLAKEICEDAEVLLFDHGTYRVENGAYKQVNGQRITGYGAYYNNGKTFYSEPTINNGSSFRGFALVDMVTKMVGGGTDIAQAVQYVNSNIKYDRLVMFTDEESSTVPPAPLNKGYVINVSSSQNGVGYGPWTHINGFSEGTLAYISEYEKEHK